MTDLRTAAQQALAFTMRDFASLRDFEAAKAVLHDNLRAALAQQEEPTIDEYPLWSGMPPPEPRIHYEGPVTFHTQRCAVLPGQHAVLQMNTGVFHPSWAAQEQGWRLVRADTGLRKLALRLFGDA